MELPTNEQTIYTIFVFLDVILVKTFSYSIKDSSQPKEDKNKEKGEMLEMVLQDIT